jgi:hypothetical protein
MIKFFSIILIILSALPAFAQLSQAERDSINRLTQVDYENMLSQIGLERNAMRRGPSGNPLDSNAANRFEDKVRPYQLPDPLVLKNGKKVMNAAMWRNQRRPEIIRDFDNEVYGKLPVNIPAVKWVVERVNDTTIGKYSAKQKILKGVVDNAAHPSITVEIEFRLFTPSNEKNTPVVIEFGFTRPFFNTGAPAPVNLLSPGEPAWNEQLLSRGWGYSILVPNSIQADNGAGLRNGIIGLVNKGQPRKPEDWGALRAWAWGASKAIDYLATDPDVDSKRIAIEGLSRYGKAAIVAMAYDERISLGFIGSSGAGGAKLLRRVFGEQVENLASAGEYHWFCGRFLKYASTHTADDLPVDAHELVALCAPRPVFISSGSPQVEGQWIDAKGMFLAGVHAGPVYKLSGKKDLGMTSFPPLGMPLIEGDLAYRQHAGGHSTGPNWSTWIAWAGRYWGAGKYD